MIALQRHWDAVRLALDNEKLRSTMVFRVEETAFLPAALEIIERPVSPTARLTARVLMIGLVLTIAWLVFGRVDVVASAPGRLIPAENVKLVQPADAGVVRAILVRDNQAVRAGQPLVQLDPTISTAEATQARKALETAELDAARARAMLSSLDGRGLVFVAPPGTSAETTAMQRALAQAELDDIRGTASMHMADRQVAIAARTEARVQAAKLAESLPLIDQQVAANEILLARGYVSKLRLIEMHRQRLAAAKDRDIALATARKAQAQIDSASGSMEQSGASARAKVLNELNRAEAEARLRREELVKATQKSTLQRLVSPVDGTVAQLAVHTVGGVVEATKPIMVIVPKGGALVAEVKVLNKDVGFIRVGQEVAVKLEAFPFTRYGTIAGKVETLSSDATQDEKLGLIYTVRITIDRQMIQRSGKVVELTPGMEVVADIRTGRRSIMSYLLSPIKVAGGEAGHEQ
jgi:hemolysin D